jgi:hypothetical protein
VSDLDGLRAWGLGWDNGGGDAALFRPELLNEPCVFMVAVRSPDGRVVAGAVASLSDQVVGISNVFALEGSPDAAWPAVLGIVNRLFPASPVVGYEHGDALAAAIRRGFEPIGPVRIWVHS